MAVSRGESRSVLEKLHNKLSVEGCCFVDHEQDMYLLRMDTNVRQPDYD